MTTDLEQASEAYDAGYLQGKKDAYDSLNHFKNVYISSLHNLINVAVAKGEFQCLVYARQLLRSLE